ncbi:MAG TPA: carboxymuconolactone decarboxylase family protein [Terriglobia bacterium]|nr:carboxymuconolactone decarboxylase family protein [Terriglobia bacterium]
MSHIAFVGCVSVFLLLAVPVLMSAQTPNTSNLGLVGDRFKPLTFDKMTPEQKTMTMNLLNGERRGMGGPFNVLLRSPELGDLAQKLGAQVRFHSSLSPKLNEMAIIITARYWTAQYEWTAHKRAALQAGLSPAIVDAIANRKRPASMEPDEEIIYNFGTELLENKHVSDAAFSAAVKRFGEKGVVDLVGVVGYYQLVSMILNVDRYPLGAGVQPELKPELK